MTGRVIVLQGDAASLSLPDASVDLVVTSPPYWGLRAYSDGGEVYGGQIGSEATPAEFIAALIGCTREWMRVLKPEGSIFVDLGDKYDSGTSTPRVNPGTVKDGTGQGWHQGTPRATTGRPKSLLGLPWRYALACMDDLGLILRAEIVWAKPNGLPESVTDRVRRAHEQVFHFTKQPRYFTAIDEIREPHQPQSIARTRRNRFAPDLSQAGVGSPNTLNPADGCNPFGKLPGSVWDIPSQPLIVPARLGVEHFAAFPAELPRRIILGWSPSGICTECGEGRRPVTSAVALDMNRPQARRARQLADRAGLTEDHLQALLAVGLGDTGRSAATQAGTGKNDPAILALAAEARAALGGYAREYLLRRPSGFSYTCACPDASALTRPAVVLDPFAGTGTTMLTASVLGRIGVGVDRSADYCRIARWRTADPAERARALGVRKPPPVSEGQIPLFGQDQEAS